MEVYKNYIEIILVVFSGEKSLVGKNIDILIINLIRRLSRKPRSQRP